MNVTTRRQPTSHKKHRSASKPSPATATTPAPAPEPSTDGVVAGLLVRLARLERLHVAELRHLEGVEEDARLLRERRERQASAVKTAIAAWRAFVKANVEPCEWDTTPLTSRSDTGALVIRQRPEPDLTIDGLTEAFDAQDRGHRIDDVVNGAELRQATIEIITGLCPDSHCAPTGWFGARLKGTTGADHAEAG